MSRWVVRDSRARPLWRGASFYLSAHWHRFWRRRCSEGCRYGEAIPADEYGPDRTYSHMDSCRRAPAYLGVLVKGWWSLWTLRDSIWRWSTKVEVAVGGEDNMLQFGLQLPILGQAHIGFRVPRAITRGWVHHRREFALELDGFWPEVRIAYDDQMADMASYYRREYEGKPLPDYLNRATLWPGWRLRVNKYRWSPRNLLLGRAVHRETPLGVEVETVVPLPEGCYPAKVTFHRDSVKRARWPWPIRDQVVAQVVTEDYMPWPGKGENSWDMDDDGTKGHHTVIGPGRIGDDVGNLDVARAVAETVAYVLRQRAKYGSVNWKPERVGVMR